MRCRDARAAFRLPMALLPGTRFEYCIYSIFFSAFQEVIFFDFDAAPLRSVSHLFKSAQYVQHGQLFFSDLWGTNSVPWGEAGHPDHSLWPFARVRPASLKCAAVAWLCAANASDNEIALVLTSYGCGWR